MHEFRGRQESPRNKEIRSLILRHITDSPIPVTLDALETLITGKYDNVTRAKITGDIRNIRKKHTILSEYVYVSPRRIQIFYPPNIDQLVVQKFVEQLTQSENEAKAQRRSDTIETQRKQILALIRSGTIITPATRTNIAQQLLYGDYCKSTSYVIENILTQEFMDGNFEKDESGQWPKYSLK